MDRAVQDRGATDRAVGSTSVLVFTSRDVWAPTRELAFDRYPSRRGWTLVRKIHRWYWVGSDRKYNEAKQVTGETRPDLDWHPKCQKRRITREVTEEKRSSRRGSAGSLVKVTKGKNHLKQRPKTRSTALVEQTNGEDICRVAPTERSGGRASAVSNTYWQNGQASERSRPGQDAQVRVGGIRWCTRCTNPDRRGLDLDGKVLEVRSSCRTTARWRSWYAAALCWCLLSSMVFVTVPSSSGLTCRLCHSRVGADGVSWGRRFLLRCRVRVSPGVMALRAGRTQSLDRIQGNTLWRGRLTISEFGIESVEFHAGAKHAELLERTNVSAISGLLAQAPSTCGTHHVAERSRQWWSRTTLL